MANRRQRKTEHGISDFDTFLNAIKAIKVEKKSIRSTAHDYSIDKSSLSRYVKKLDKEVPDITKVSDANLLVIVRRIGSYATTKMFSMVNKKKLLLDISCNAVIFIMA